MTCKFITLVTTILLSLVVFNSCKTDVDIYAEGNETTIVYGYLDADADTNYLKITKSFLGNAIELAPDYSASNYDYKLMVKLIGKFADMPNTVSTEILDTTSVFKPYDPDGIFYSGRDQVLYFTTRQLKENEDYQLVIERNDGEVVTSEVRTISGSRLKQPTNNISFDPASVKQVKWTPEKIDERAAYYEVIGYFHYKQLNPGETDTVSYTVEWPMGAGTGDDLWNSGKMEMSVNYIPNTFYNRLASDKNIIYNSPSYVQRFVEDFEIVITATGEELYRYFLIQNSGSAIQDTPEYTNIENGVGILSSRSATRRTIDVSTHSINTLISDYPEWGFKKLPGQ
ncbi:MAG: DUF4249 family protein [Bacteroidales bacterium]|nr:DUF4249 family protein [Bacteroidales bacterium]